MKNGRGLNEFFTDLNRYPALAGAVSALLAIEATGGFGNLFFVVYTIRDDVIRIISARKATSRERRLYHGNR